MKWAFFALAFVNVGVTAAATPTGEIIGCDQTHPKYRECLKMLEQQKAARERDKARADLNRANKEMAEFQNAQRIREKSDRQATLRYNRDVEDSARLERLRINCELWKQQADRATTKALATGANQVAPNACAQYNSALEERRRYELLRIQNPEMADRELEGRRSTR